MPRSLMMRDRFCSRRRLLGIILASFLLLQIRLVLRWFWPSEGYQTRSAPPSGLGVASANQLYSPPPPSKASPSAQSLAPPSASKHASSSACKGYSTQADVIIVVKTGATEASRKLPLQLLSFLSCAKDNVLVFSDMAQRVGDLEVYDSLDDVAEEARFNNTDFVLYEDQKQYVLDGEDIGMLSNRAHESWAMDKYKNIHVAQKTWKLRPNRSWYFFIDADTYVVWPSFFAWLKQFDATRKLYLGAEVPSEYYPFGHGGSGYALSRGALEALVGHDAERIAKSFDTDVRNICCGDIELGKSLYEKKILITDAHPMVNGEKARRYKFGPKLWCQPLVTMHHIHAEEMNDLWQFELSRPRPEKPLLFEELFNDYLAKRLPARRAGWDRLSDETKSVTFPAERDDWENLSDDITYEPPNPDAKVSKGIFDWGSSAAEDPHRDAYQSLEQCIQACKALPECFQYQYSHNKTCGLSKSFRLGNRRAPEGEETTTMRRWRSGWDLDRIDAFRAAHSPCQAVDYKTYNQ